MKILGVDTSSQLCSVAMISDGVTFEYSKATANNQSDHLLPMIHELVEETRIPLSELDAIAVGNGPGSFIGLRIGLGVCQGMALALSKPLICVSSQAAIAQCSDADHIAVALDARLGQIFWACYHRGADNTVEEENQETLIRPEEVLLSSDYKWTAMGNAWKKYHTDLLKRFSGLVDRVVDNETPSACGVAELATALFKKGAYNKKPYEIEANYLSNNLD